MRGLQIVEKKVVIESSAQRSQHLPKIKRKRSLMAVLVLGRPVDGFLLVLLRAVLKKMGLLISLFASATAARLERSVEEQLRSETAKYFLT